MKNVLKGLLFWITIVAIIITVSVITNILANLITMKTIMTVVYIALGFGVIYILNN